MLTDEELEVLLRRHGWDCLDGTGLWSKGVVNSQCAIRASVTMKGLREASDPAAFIRDAARRLEGLDLAGAVEGRN